MNAYRCSYSWMLAFPIFICSGCVVRNVDFSDIRQPARAAQLDAYEVFVGSWDWEAKMIDASKGHESWSGMARWYWSLDRRVLEGRMESKSGDLQFQATGMWSWHPRDKKYIWWMINNWGYPQEGTARYYKNSQTWVMDYRSVGLDGTTSYGRYQMDVLDNDTIAWKMQEWLDPIHAIRKTAMVGTYKRRK